MRPAPPGARAPGIVLTHRGLRGILRRAMGRAGIVQGYRHVCRRKGCDHAENATDQEQRRCPNDGRKLWVRPVVRPLRFHDLRHTTGSHLIMSGADLAAVQRILRHSDPKLTTEVYAHLAPEYLRAEVDRLSFGAAVLATVPRSLPGAREFATRLLPEPAGPKKKAGSPRGNPLELPAFRVERETGFGPATLSLGS